MLFTDINVLLMFEEAALAKTLAFLYFSVMPANLVRTYCVKIWETLCTEQIYKWL